MESFLIYRCADGGYLFCPDCVQASIKAEHNYGPLELLGIISRAELDEIVAAKVEQEVADHLYAHVDAGQVETLDLDLAVHSDSQVTRPEKLGAHDPHHCAQLFGQSVCA